MNQQGQAISADTAASSPMVQEREPSQTLVSPAPAKRILIAEEAAVEQADARIAEKFADMFRKLAE